jgi:hypothetical protein
MVGQSSLGSKRGLGSCENDMVCGLVSILIALQGPKYSNLINVQINGLMKTMNTAACDSHGGRQDVPRCGEVVKCEA